MKRYLFILASMAGILLPGYQSAYAQTGPKGGGGLLAVNEFSVYAYDSILARFKHQSAVESYDRFVNEFIDLDLDRVDMRGALPDQVYAERLKLMATEVQLPYNPVVKRYIQTYTQKGGVMERVLGLGQYYFPIFEEALYRHGLPMELKMLPVIESALIPRARSRMSAMGLWQFMLRTGKAYGLEVNTFVDERCDPVKSTEAACRYLRDLYRIYNDWTLAIAAYNCGTGNVNKALARVPGAKTYWDIYDYLPRETRGYVPAFIAATYAYTYYRAHDLRPVAPWHPVATDTVHVDRMMHLEQIGSVIDLPVEVLRGLNPQYSIDVIPAKASTYALVLPQEYVGSYIRQLDAIYAREGEYLEKYLNVSNLSDMEAVASTNSGGGATPGGAVASTPAGKTRTTYKVRSGDVLGKIAERYDVRLSDLMSWNKIRDARRIQIGQTLVIYR